MHISRRDLLCGSAGLLLASAGARAAGPLFTALERLDRGRLIPATLHESTRRILIYCGAGWCGPCRAFQVRLRAAQEQLQKESAIEIMYVGHDSTVQAHRDYVIRERMPWLLARHDAPATRQLRALGGKALPGLLLMDMSGQLLRTSWTADGASAPARLLNELI